MLITRKKVPAAESLEVISNVLLASFIFAILYFARQLLIPLALASLLTFLLGPLATKLQRWLGRVGAVLFVVAMMFCATGFFGWVLTRQAVDLAAQLPNYKENISAKLRSIKVPQFNSIGSLSETISDLKKDFTEVVESGTEALPDLTLEESTSTGTGSDAAQATPVEVVSGRKAHLEFAQVVLTSILGSLATAGLIVLLVIFMLLCRDDLRNRILRLVGQGRISATSRAMDEAGTSVAKYLLMQLIVNVTYGIPVAIGLYFIGVPNAILWGALCTVLRFIPYVGPWIGAFFPILMSLTVSAGWIAPILTISLFIVLELISNNIAEPILYGSTTGVTPIALIVAALAWTWLWGPVGLILATPITVCLVVMGRHIPRLSFLSVILSDERPLTEAEEFYQWLLRRGEGEELEFVDRYLKSHSEVDLYESVLLPVLSAVESDYREEMISKDELIDVQRRVRAVLEDVELHFNDEAEIPDVNLGTIARISCVPVSSRRDELAGEMLMSLLHRRGYVAEKSPASLVSGELMGWLRKAAAEVVCLTAVSPTTFFQVRYLCLKLRSQFPEMKVVVFLHGISEDSKEDATRLRESGADEVVTSLHEAAGKVIAHSSALPSYLAPQERG